LLVAETAKYIISGDKLRCFGYPQGVEAVGLAMKTCIGFAR
jgi:hypothetical protein